MVGDVEPDLEDVRDREALAVHGRAEDGLSSGRHADEHIDGLPGIRGGEPERV
jgi:hypothetical protein